MNPKASSCRTLAFTLVEMLVVIAIIGILAALLMPVLNKAEQRAKLIFCTNSQQQIGLAFHAFSNDHNGKFPMALSTNDGGSLEYVESGLNSSQDFYTAFRNFQPLSNELVSPQTLVCPTDTRIATNNFALLQNQNLSYAVSVLSTFDKPTSMLACDRNLNIGEEPKFAATIAEFPTWNNKVSWTWELHQFKGNMLFADGHVEEWNDSSLAPADSNILFRPTVVESILPIASGGPGSGPVSSGPSPSSGPGSAPSSPSEQMEPSSPSAPGASAASLPSQDSSPPVGQSMPSRGGSSGQQLSQTETVSQTQASDQNVAATDRPPTSTDTDAVVSVQDPNSGMSDFDRHMTMVMQGSLIWLYILLCILVLLYLLYRVVRRKYEKWARQSENERRL